MALVQCNFQRSEGNIDCYVTLQTIKDEKIKFKQFVTPLKFTNTQVKILKFSECIFTKFPKNLHENFPNLTTLDFIDCKLNSVDRENIGNLKKLTQIQFVNCGLKKLKGDIFRDLKNLQCISFENNKLEEIEPNILDGLDKLYHVNFLGNVNINMEYPANLMNEIKKEVREKCKPQKTTNLTPVKPTSQSSEVQKLKKEIETLKIELHRQEQQAKTNRTKFLEIQQENSKNSAKLNRLMKILTDESFKDFTINIDDSSFKVHKTLFAARSPTLAEILRNNPEAQELNLRDIPEATFKAVHDFIYTNQLSDDANHLQIYAAAGRLKMNDLLNATSTHLLENINEDNAFEILVISNKFYNEKLQKKSFEFIKMKIFPDRELDIELAKQPEKLKRLIDAKKKLDQEFEDVMKGGCEED